MFYHLPDGRVASVYRIFLFPKRDKRGEDDDEEEENDSDANPKMVSNGLEKLREAIKEVNQTLTAVILTGGGHFASAIYSGNVVSQVSLPDKMYGSVGQSVRQSLLAGCYYRFIYQ